MLLPFLLFIFLVVFLHLVLISFFIPERADEVGDRGLFGAPLLARFGFEGSPFFERKEIPKLPPECFCRGWTRGRTGRSHFVDCDGFLILFFSTRSTLEISIIIFHKVRVERVAWERRTGSVAYSQCIRWKDFLSKELFDSFIYPPHELEAFIFALNYCLLNKRHVTETRFALWITLMQESMRNFTLHNLHLCKTHTPRRYCLSLLLTCFLV